MYWEIIGLLLTLKSVQLRYLNEDIMMYWRRSGPEKCEPFTTSTIDCNKCICGADGLQYCTRMYCLRKSRKLTKSEEEEYVKYNPV